MINQTEIKIVRDSIEKSLLESELTVFTAIQVDVEKVKELREHELQLIKTIADEKHITEFEASPHERSFFSQMEEQMESDDVLLLYSIALPYRARRPHGQVVSGQVDDSSRTFDYHKRFSEKMKKVIEALRIMDLPEAVEIEPQWFIDTAPYFDRELAFITGLGNYGKNHMLICPEYGSRFHIGHFYLLVKETEKIFEERSSENPRLPIRDLQRLNIACANCDLCVRACPAKICGRTEMDRTKCVSYLTQTKKLLMPDQVKRISNHLYGCDICQQVCPLNQAQTVEETLEQMDLIDILKLSQRGFKRLYGETGFSWRGVKVIKRNALIAILNSGMEGMAVEAIKIEGLFEDNSLRPYVEMLEEKYQICRKEC